MEFKETSYTLILNELEAKWLKRVMQNPFHHSELLSVEDEGEQDREMRITFWDVLRNKLED